VTVEDIAEERQRDKMRRGASAARHGGASKTSLMTIRHADDVMPASLFHVYVAAVDDRVRYDAPSALRRRRRFALPRYRAFY